jgi:predicted secreted acid phosphatase
VGEPPPPPIAGTEVPLGCEADRGPLYFDVSRPTNIDQYKRQLLYYRCTDYDREVAETLSAAKQWVQSRAPLVTNPAIVLDIDETSISNWIRIKMDDFGYVHGDTCEEKKAHDKKPPSCGAEGWDENADAPAIKPMLDLFNFAKCNGGGPCTKVAVFFVTGRYDEDREKEWTETNLTRAAYAAWDGLYMRNTRTKGRPVSEHKIEAREDIEAKGFTIIANIGDQESDLVGGHAERAFKIPNPFYFIP